MKKISFQNTRYSDLGPLAPVSLGGLKCTFNVAYVIDSTDMTKYPIYLGGVELKSAWKDGNLPLLTFSANISGADLVITHNDRNVVSYKDKLTISNCEILETSAVDALIGGDPNYLDTHTRINICDFSLINGIPKFSSTVTSNIYTSFFGELV